MATRIRPFPWNCIYALCDCDDIYVACVKTSVNKTNQEGGELVIKIFFKSFKKTSPNIRVKTNTPGSLKIGFPYNILASRNELSYSINEPTGAGTWLQLITN